MVINLYARSKKVVPQKELRRQMVESVCLSFVTNTNLESTAIAKLCRSVTFYFNLIFHILQISLIFLMSQFIQEDEYEYVPFWVNFPLVKEHNWAMPALVLSVILAGIFSLLLDLVFFYCCKSGVYNFSKLKIGGETKDLQLKCIKTTTISHSKYIVNKYRWPASLKHWIYDSKVDLYIFQVKRKIAHHGSGGGMIAEEQKLILT